MSIFARGYLVNRKVLVSLEEGSLDPISFFVELDDRRSNKGSIISPACSNLFGRSPNLG